MIALAAKLLRHRAGPAVATLIALAAGVVILVAMGTLVESGLRLRPEPVLYRSADLVVAHREVSYTGKDLAGDVQTSTATLPEGGTVDAGLAASIRRVPGVEVAAGDDGVIVDSPAAMGHGWSIQAFAGRELTAGEAPTADDEIVADVRLGALPGSSLDLGVAGSYRVTGVIDTGSPQVFFTDARAARLSAHPGRFDAIGVRVAPGADRAAVTAAVQQVASAAGARTYAGKDRGQAEQPAVMAARALLVQAGSAFGGYVILLVVFVAGGTIGLSVRHRRRDLALLRAVAATPGQLRRLLMAETVLLSLVASAIGVPPGLLAAHAMLGELVTRGILPATYPLTVGALSAVIAVGIVALVAVLAALIAGRRATKIKPVEALGEVAVERKRSGRVRLVFGLLAVFGAGASGALTAGLGGATLALGGAVGMLYLFVTAVALLAPWINAFGARLLTPVLSRVWRVSGYLAAANLRANAQGMATVLTALVLSVGFGGSVWFLQDNIERQTIAENRAGTLADRVVVGVPGQAPREIRQLAGVRAATGVRRTSVVMTSFDGVETVVAQAVDPEKITDTMDLDVYAGSLADLRDGTVALSAMRASASGRHLGDRVDLWLGDGTPASLEVVAIYRRGLGFGDVTLAKQTVAGHTARAADDEVLVRTVPGNDAALAAWTAAHPGSAVINAADRTRMLSTDLAVSAWLNKLLVAVMIGYAALAAAATMVMAALARRRELALLRLVGATRRQIRRMVHAEQTALLGTAALIGVAIAAVTLVTIVRALTGNPVPYIPPLGGIAVLGGVTLLALVTTVLPIRRLLRAAPIENIGIRD